MNSYVSRYYWAVKHILDHGISVRIGCKYLREEFNQAFRKLAVRIRSFLLIVNITKHQAPVAQKVDMAIHWIAQLVLL